MIHLTKLKITTDHLGKHALFPVYNSDMEKLNKVNKPVLVDIKSSRNPKHHSLIFGLARLTREHLDVTHPLKEASLYVIVKAIMYDIGLVDQVPDLRTGELRTIVKSISFADMSEEEFESVSDAVFKSCADTCQISEIDLRREYKKYL